MACHLGEKQNIKDQNKIDLEIVYYHLTTNLFENCAAPRTLEGTHTTTTSYLPPLRSQVQEDIVADTDQVETQKQTQTYTKTESKTPNASKKSLSSIWDQPVHVGQSKGWSKTRLVWVYVDRWRRSRSVSSYPFRSGLFFATTLMLMALLMNTVMCMITMKITPGSLARGLVHVWQACHHFRLWHRLYLLYRALSDKVVQSVTMIKEDTFVALFCENNFFSCSGSAVLGWEPLQWPPGQMGTKYS